MKELEILEKYQQQLIEDTQAVLRFDTVKSEKTDTAPFGQGNADCLAWALKLCEKYGFTTQNFDNYAGHADFGNGKEVFGILGHLDVMPANEDGWISPPFDANIIDGSIYARGALDDKSPMIACLYAVRCLAEAGYKFNKKVRLIFGCDEESGMQCMKYYFTKMPQPDFAISPDANFPVINREKGIMNVVLDCGELPSGIIFLEGGSRANAVMDKCTVVLQKDVDISAVVEKYSNDEEIEIVKGGEIKITVKGASAHGSTPELGKNASWKMFDVLSLIYPDNTTVNALNDRLTDYYGQKWGVNLEDTESGKLTVNVGVIKSEKNKLLIIVDCRHPVTFTNAQVKKVFEDNTAFADLFIGHASEPLFVPEESDLVQKLLKAYHNATGNPSYAIAIGGGTYSRCIKNCVAFGPEWPGEEAIIHQPNERIKISRLIEITKVYMEAIKLLCCE